MSERITTVDEFKARVVKVEGSKGYVTPAGYGIGVATTSTRDDGTAVIVDARFLTVNFGENSGTAAMLADHLGPLTTGHRNLQPADLDALLDRFVAFRDTGGHANVDALELLRKEFPREHRFGGHGYQPVVAILVDVDDEPKTAVDVYFRLHLLSHCKTPPRSLNLNGAFGKLNNNVWTTAGVIDQASFDAIQRQRTATGEPLIVVIQDKFPRMLDYVTPPGVRILNPNNVRLGAHCAPGTVCMTGGAINFNAGTLGEAMIEGRVSAGITIGARSDIGGGASTLGTLSGGNDIVVSIGEDCLLEATAGVGIPLGDRVRVEVGFYVKSTTPIHVADDSWPAGSVAEPYQGQTVKAVVLAGISDAIFRRNAYTGTPEVVPRGDRVWGSLNAELHAN